MIERTYLQSLRDRMNEQRMFIQVIVGPRQVGKTTMVNQLLEQTDKNFIFESADAVGSASTVWLTQIWDSARVRMQINNLDEFWIIIDEIQKIEGWSETVKLNWDKDTNEKRKIKVILLGSSRLLIQKGLTESLAGRFEKTYLGHWSFDEMQRAFGWSLEQYIYYGGYPGSAPLISDEKRWKSYILDALIEASISKDILMLTRVDKPALLKRLFELGSIYSGQILSLTKLIGEMQDAGNTTTLTHYLSLLSDCGLLGGVSKYAGEEVRSRASQPKFQVYNNALLTSQSRDSFENVILNPKQWGRLVESSVGAHLINFAAIERYNLHYWRERNDEVDFVMELKGKLVGIEVKSGRRGENKGMKIFAEKFNPEKVIVVGTGGIPLDEFLSMNPVDLFL
ncbi:MAG: ATP-binding protein [Rikenellaceae bacterium]